MTCSGKGGSQHLCRGNFYSNGVLGSIVPVATGIALAEKRKGTGAVSTVFLGDGTLGEGVTYESLNMASLWKLPVLFVVENNHYAQSTPVELELAGSIPARAEAFGVETAELATTDVEEIHEAAGRAVAHVRETGEPFFLVLDTYRFSPHSKGDDNRDPDEIEARRERDPLKVGERLDGAERDAIHVRCEERLAETVRRGRGRGSSVSKRCVQVLNETLHELFASRDDVSLLGEDVLDPYGGAFKVTQGLSDAYPDRVLTTPISEASLFGVAAGMALRGERPILEIMFGDFVALGFDQIVNGIAKFREMYDDQVTVPLVVRTPMGGRRGYGPTHSQSLEKLLLGVPNIVVVAASECHDLRSLSGRSCRRRPPGVLHREQAHVRPAEPASRRRARRRARGARDRRPLPGADLLGQRLLRGHGDGRDIRRHAPCCPRRRDRAGPRARDLL